MVLVSFTQRFDTMQHSTVPIRFFTNEMDFMELIHVILMLQFDNGVCSCIFEVLTISKTEFYYALVAGGTFALYSLICRHAKVSLLPNRQVSDEALSTYKLEHPPETKNSSWVKSVLEKHKFLHTALLILVLLGTCMVIGDGLLTPAISGWLWTHPILYFTCAYSVLVWLLHIANV